MITGKELPGSRLGPKKAAVLYRDLGIATLEQLKEACETQQVRALKGFGAKTEEVILKGMSIAEAERWLAPNLGYDPLAAGAA